MASLAHEGCDGKGNGGGTDSRCGGRVAAGEVAVYGRHQQHAAAALAASLPISMRALMNAELDCYTACATQVHLVSPINSPPPVKYPLHEYEHHCQQRPSACPALILRLTSVSPVSGSLPRTAPLPSALHYAPQIRCSVLRSVIHYAL